MSGLNFRQLPVANGTAFSKIFKKDDNLTRYTQIFETFFPEFSFHSTLLPEFLEFSVEWFAFRKFNSFRISWKLFRKIAAPFAAVSKFSKVLVEWSKVTDRARVQVSFVTIFRFLVPRYVLTTFVAFECNLFRRSSLKPMFTLTTLQAFVFVLAKLVKR